MINTFGHTKHSFNPFKSIASLYPPNVISVVPDPEVFPIESSQTSLKGFVQGSRCCNSEWREESWNTGGCSDACVHIGDCIAFQKVLDQ